MRWSGTRKSPVISTGASAAALNCFVIEGGEITVGDEVQLVHGSRVH